MKGCQRTWPSIQVSPCQVTVKCKKNEVQRNVFVLTYCMLLINVLVHIKIYSRYAMIIQILPTTCDNDHILLFCFVLASNEIITINICMQHICVTLDVLWDVF